ncbi:MAG: type II secretion system protein GspM [Sphingomonadaceae bacterium]
MIERLRTAWQERSARERVMLGAMFVVIGLTLLWFGIIAPTISGLEAARARHSRAVIDLASVQGKAALLKRLNETPPPPLGAPVATFVKLAADEAGFVLARSDAVGTDSVAIAMVSAKPAAFFKWVGTLDQKGVFVDQMTIRTNADATIAVDATLKARSF